MRIRRHHLKLTDEVIEISAIVITLLNVKKDNKDREWGTRGNKKHANFIIVHDRKIIGTV